MKNIAFIYPRFTGPFGGERHILKLAEELVLIGHSVTIYTCMFDANTITDSSRKITIKQVTNIAVGSHNLRTLMAFVAMPALALKVSRDHDIVIGMGWQSSFGLKTLLTYRKYRPTSLVYYCLEPPRFLYDLYDETLGDMKKLRRAIFIPIFAIIRLIDKRSVHSIKRIMANSEWSATQLKKIYSKDAKIVYPGIEIDRFRNLTKKDARKNLGIAMSKKIYITVSKLHKRKLLNTSIAEYLRHERKNTIYFIIGDGPDKQRLEKIVRKNSTSKIVLLGKLSDELVTNYMCAADYFIFTAKNEPYGLAPLEAQLAGCEVIPDRPKYSPRDWFNTAKCICSIIERES
jgi:glycosyltransferase involved in cell wall biosynthesis